MTSVIRTGDITAGNSPAGAAHGHYCHMFTAAELGRFLEAHGLEVEFASASNSISALWNDLLDNPEVFERIQALEEEAAVAPGAIDMGSHIIAVARRG